MTPVLHHFEQRILRQGSPWSEWKVDFFFWELGFSKSLDLSLFIPTVKLTFDETDAKTG